MSMSQTHHLLRGVGWSLALLLVLLPACGRKGSPLPPLLVVPAAVGNLRAEPGVNSIILSWTRPDRNVDGSRLTDLQGFRILRAVGGAVGTAPAEAGFSPLATVQAEQPENATVQGAVFAFRDDAGGRGLTLDTRYRYRVVAVNRRGEPGVPSAEVAVHLTRSPVPPTGLRATPGDGVVDLEWQAPVTAEAGSPPVRRYNVYRGLRSGLHGPQPINARPLAETRFRDGGVANDATYFYVVRSVGTERPPWRESVDSPEVAVTPLDHIAPAPPAGLVAIPGDGVVSLSWHANTEPDILGYLVYRREVDAASAVRLTEAPVSGTTFTDRTLRAGITYAYTVTAVDRSSHRNESAPSAEVEVRLP